MLEKEFCLLNSAYESYNLDQRENISKEVLEYTRSRIEESKELIENIIKYSKEDITFKKILQVFDEESAIDSKYNKSGNSIKLENNYMYDTYITSVGNIVVECSETLTVLRYYIKAIKSRNTITISDSKYDDVSLKSALLIIFCEALSHFGIDMNLIMLIPYEECYYDKYDKLIYADAKKNTIKKENINKVYIYVEDHSFKKNIDKEKLALGLCGKEYEILTGDFYEAVKRINEKFSVGACIYTKNNEIATKFINLVHCKNVFVNYSLAELENVQDLDDELYMMKKVMYPIENQENEEVEETQQEEYDDAYDVVYHDIRNISTENMQLVKKETSPWYIRIFESIKKFFEKFHRKDRTVSN